MIVYIVYRSSSSPVSGRLCGDVKLCQPRVFGVDATASASTAADAADFALRLERNDALEVSRKSLEFGRGTLSLISI